MGPYEATGKTSGCHGRTTGAVIGCRALVSCTYWRSELFPVAISWGRKYGVAALCHGAYRHINTVRIAADTDCDSSMGWAHPYLTMMEFGELP